MLITTISEFEKNIKHYLDQIADNDEKLVINREEERAVVIMSLKEYNSFKATHHELSSRANQRRLDSAIEKIMNRPSRIPS